MQIEFTICTQNMLLAYLQEPITPQKQAIIWAMSDAANELKNVRECVCGMNNIAVFTHDISYDELKELKSQLERLFENLKPRQIQGRVVEIQVSYGGEAGIDLISMAESKNMSAKEIVRLHTEPFYTVFFLGFLPGFAYLGGLDERLHHPRLASPRKSIAAGSVGIGGAQTGIYPSASPGGWNLIGKTDAVLFDPKKSEPNLLKAGDKLKFIAKEILL